MVGFVHIDVVLVLLPTGVDFYCVSAIKHQGLFDCFALSCLFFLFLAFLFIGVGGGNVSVSNSCVKLTRKHIWNCCLLSVCSEMQHGIYHT